MEQPTVKQLVDRGICPTCYDREHSCCLYGYHPERIIYRNNDFECFLVGNPRSEGHTVISSTKHYKNMAEIPDDLCRNIFIFAKFLMNVIKEVYKCESVYLCTMCDGPMNHFHIQLIPRYASEDRGSKNFVKPRKDYTHQEDKIMELRKKVQLNQKIELI